MTKRIAVCFFGITRSLRHTCASLEAHILAPARALGEVQVHAHFFEQARIENPRSGEFGELDPEEHRLLRYDSLQLEPPGACLEARGFEALKSHGDEWEDEFASLRNLVHQLHSLDCVTAKALEGDPDVVLFCRPDLLYFDSLGPAIEAALAQPAPLVQLPYWQSWRGGLNDRFAIISGRDAIAAYGGRISQALPFCEANGVPLHAERLIRHVTLPYPVQEIGARASRMRFDGTLKFEDFDHRATVHNANRLRRRLPGGLATPFVKLVYLAQHLRLGDRYAGGFGDVAILRPDQKPDQKEAT